MEIFREAEHFMYINILGRLLFWVHYLAIEYTGEARNILVLGGSTVQSDIIVNDTFPDVFSPLESHLGSEYTDWYDIRSSKILFIKEQCYSKVSLYSTSEIILKICKLLL